MNKTATLLALLILSNCAYLNYSALPSLAKSIAFGAEDIVVDSQFFEDQPFSFVKVQIGRRAIAIFSLSSIADNRYEWISSSGDKLTTLSSGQVSKFIGDDFSFTLIPALNFSYSFQDSQTLDYFIQLYNPIALFSQTGVVSDDGLKSFDYMNQSSQSLFFTESVESNTMNWAYVNKYHYDVESNLPLYTSQHFNPLFEPLELTFYYKY
jgi:hypothetical protein